MSPGGELPLEYFILKPKSKVVSQLDKLNLFDIVSTKHWRWRFLHVSVLL